MSLLLVHTVGVVSSWYECCLVPSGADTHTATLLSQAPRGDTMSDHHHHDQTELPSSASGSLMYLRYCTNSHTVTSVSLSLMYLRYCTNSHTVTSVSLSLMYLRYCTNSHTVTSVSPSLMYLSVYMC